MCQGCVNPAVAFSWLGAILVNSAFIALISWGTANYWPIGLAISMLYTALLFCVAQRLRKREDSPSVVIDILLLLGVVGIGSTGLILTYNLLGCGAMRSVTPVDSTSWVFPSSAAGGLAEVSTWAAQNKWESGNAATFAYEPTSANVFFRGRNVSSGSEMLWMAAAGGVAEPRVLDTSLSYPSDMVAGSQRLFFTADTSSGPRSVYSYSADGSAYTQLSSPDSSGDLSNPGGLLIVNGSLYIKADAPFGTTPAEGVVYRATPPFVTTTLLSEPVSATFPPPPPPAAPGSTGVGCDTEAGFRTMAIGTLCVATLPSLAASAVLWVRLGAPSMSFATYSTISALVLNVYIIIQPSGADGPEVIKWWFFLSGAAWLVLFATLRLQRRVDLGTFRWAVDVGCIAYVASMHAIVQVPFTADAWRWVLYQATMLVPMLLLALICAKTTAGLPIVLSSVALFIDAYKITIEVTNLLSDTTLSTFVTFAILGLVGMGVVAAGLSYNRYQDAIVDFVEGFAARACGPCRKPARTMDAAKSGADGDAVEKPADNNFVI